MHRLVFVCQGNICRSPYAHALAAREPSLCVTSIGYATTTGLPADEVAREVARERGISLDEHRTTDIGDFAFRAGDLALVMEDRHVPKVERQVREADAQLTLLGLWARPAHPLIYDPKSLTPEYFHACYRVIENAVENVGIMCSENARATA